MFPLYAASEGCALTINTLGLAETSKRACVQCIFTSNCTSQDRGVYPYLYKYLTRIYGVCITHTYRWVPIFLYIQLLNPLRHARARSSGPSTAACAHAIDSRVWARGCYMRRRGLASDEYVQCSMHAATLAVAACELRQPCELPAPLQGTPREAAHGRCQRCQLLKQQQHPSSCSSTREAKLRAHPCIRTVHPGSLRLDPVATALSRPTG